MRAQGWRWSCPPPTSRPESRPTFGTCDLGAPNGSPSCGLRVLPSRGPSACDPHVEFVSEHTLEDQQGGQEKATKRGRLGLHCVTPGKSLNSSGPVSSLENGQEGSSVLWYEKNWLHGSQLARCLEHSSP